MQIKALSPWLGSKRLMAQTIIEQLGEHKSYVEPFCGSMAVLLAKKPCAFEIVNDLHGDLVNLALTVQHERWGPWLYRQLRRCLYAEAAFATAGEQMAMSPIAATAEDVGLASAQRAKSYFLLSWMGRSGTLGTTAKPSFTLRYTHSGGNQAQRFHGAVSSLPAWRRRLRSVTILHRDGLELLGRLVDEKGLAIYIDPPYLVKSACYQHDFTDAQHTELAKLLHRFQKARVVVSYYQDARLAHFYSHKKWLYVSCTRNKQMSVQARRESRAQTAPEVLLVNRSA